MLNEWTKSMIHLDRRNDLMDGKKGQKSLTNLNKSRSGFSKKDLCSLLSLEIVYRFTRCRLH